MLERSNIRFTTKQKMLIAVLLILFIVAGRLLPHMWNMTPVVAATLFSAVYLGKRYAFAVPALAMFASDLFIGFYDLKLLAVVYVSFAAIAGIGFLLKKGVTAGNILLGSVVSSTIFFFVTNWAVWQFSIWYPKTFTGLLQAYAMGIPFFKNALVGDIMYTGVLFGAYALAVRMYYYKSIKTQSCYVINK